MMGYYGNWDGGTSMMGWSGFGWFFMIFFWVLVIAAFFIFIKWMNDQNRHNGVPEKEKTAMSILEERYAKGEIDREEFLKMKKDLNGA